MQFIHFYSDARILPLWIHTQTRRHPGLAGFIFFRSISPKDRERERTKTAYISQFFFPFFFLLYKPLENAPHPSWMVWSVYSVYVYMARVVQRQATCTNPSYSHIQYMKISVSCLCRVLCCCCSFIIVDFLARSLSLHRMFLVRRKKKRKK